MPKAKKTVREFHSFAALSSWSRFEASKKRGGGKPQRLPPPKATPPQRRQ